MTRARPACAGLVLAAGASRRMGRPKQLLALAGRPLLQHVVDAAAASSLAETVVVLGHEAEAIRAALAWPARVRPVVHPGWAAGQSSSLRCGLDALGDEVAAAVVLLGDQPDVTSALIDAVADAFHGAGRPALRPVFVAADGTRVPGHPVVLGRALWPAITGREGDAGARGLFAAHPERLHELPLAVPPPRDLDDAEDYRRALATRAAGAGGT